MPSDFTVKQNDAAAFEATDNHSFTAFLSPWNDEKLSAKDVAFAAFNGYTPAADRKIVESFAVEGSVGGFEAYVIVGEGTIDGKELRFVFLGLINPDSDANVYARLLWWDNPDLNKQRELLAVKIAESFQIAK